MQPKTILLVDDDPLVLALLAHVVGQLAPMHAIVTPPMGGARSTCSPST